MPPRQMSRYASKGAFDLLAADDVDEEGVDASEDDDDAPIAPAPPASTPAGSTKLTKTQQKKLAKEAREAKKAEKQVASATPTPPDENSRSVPNENAASGIADVAAPHAERSSPTIEIPVQRVAPADDPATASAAPGPVPNGAAAGIKAANETLPSPAARRDAAAGASGVSSSSTAAAPKPAPASAPRAAAPASRPPAAEPTPEDIVAECKAAERAAYWRKIRERTTFTFVMIFGFVGLLSLGHPYMIILVLAIQVLVYREVTALFEIPGRPSITGGAPRRHVLSRHNSTQGKPATAKARSQQIESAQVSDDEDDFREEERKELLWSKTLSWYFFTVANYFLYGESLIYYFKHIVFVDSYFIPFARHHRFLSFLLYIIGFVGFVSGLRRENLKHQFGLFGWVHMSLLLIVFSSHFLVNNILEGLIWFFVPASLVICNDVFAYVCGMIWGRTPLISLSPKKTVEGFVGAFLITEVFAIGWATYFQRFNYMICPAVSLGMNAFQQIECKPNPVFEWHSLPIPGEILALLPPALVSALPGTSIPYTYFQLHSLVMAAFASLVAPFGGFFASGFKRAFNIKDFGDSIPGHGGLTDRFDCQFLMGLFSYVYYSSLIRENTVTVGSVLQMVVAHLGQEEQVEAYREIGRYLSSRGIKV